MNRSVLLVDDDEIDTLINEKIINTLGLINEVHKARNGDDALKVLNQQILAEGKISTIILLDLNMPILDGFGFIKAFQENFPSKHNTEIIIMTSSRDQSDINRAKELGVKHYLLKPIDGAKLKSIILESAETD